MTPYHESDGVTLYHGDCREILPQLGRFDLLLTDPPYGIDVGSMGMGKGAKASEFDSFDWDKEKPDLQFALQACQDWIVWGGNYFGWAESPCVLIWDKMQEFSGAEFELAATSLRMPSKAFRLSRVEAYAKGKQHPTQKPVALMRWCLQFIPNAKTILDPFAGSGTTLLAAKLEGRKAVGIEISEEYCEIAANRLRQRLLF